MNFVAAREGVQIALDALRSNKVRAALTILGIVIGVATVVAMAAVIGGVRSSIVGQLESMGPKNFTIERFDQTQLQFVNSGDQRPPWEGMDPITLDEAEMIARLPSISSVATAVPASGDLRWGAQTVPSVSVLGRSHQWPDYATGEFLEGRNFLPTDDARASAVAVLSKDLAEALFGGRRAVGRSVRIGGELFTVVGVYEMTENLFSAAMRNWLIVPTSAAVKRLSADDDWLSLLVVPSATVTQDEAMDEVTAALRASRGLGPGEENTFALVRQEAFLDMFNRITGIFFLAMLVLSSIGLMVGGIGVIAIMLISVTERTREIGVRKALGATRREILWQFLVESMTVTVIGGAIGLLLGGGGAMLIARFTPLPAAVPLWSVAAAIAVSAVTGIGFGLYPANRAARMDPVEALRHE